MGIVGQPLSNSACGNASFQNTKTVTVLGRLQEMSACKEIIRQIPLELQHSVVNGKDWLFQRTLTSGSPYAVFPFSTDRQIYRDANHILQSVEGVTNTTNDVQPNFIYIMSDYPLKVTFGYSDSTIYYCYDNTSTPDTGSVAAVADYSSTVAGTILITTTENPHSQRTGSLVTLSGTTDYDGTYEITSVDDTHFYVTATWNITRTGTWTTDYPSLYPQPANLNQSFIVNGYYLTTEPKIDQIIAPKTAADVATWGHYSGYADGTSTFSGTWLQASGRSESFPIFPVRVQKSTRYTQTIVKIYAAVLSL